MRAASTLIFAQSQQSDNGIITGKRKKKNIEINPNVLSLRFTSLKEFDPKTCETSPLIQCMSCKAVLTAFSKQSIFTGSEYQNRLDEINKSKLLQVKQDAKPSEEQFLDVKKLPKDCHIWICDFCGIHQKLTLNPKQSLSDKEEVCYMIKKPKQPTNWLGMSKGNKEPSKDDKGLIFCVDFSGSMAMGRRKECVVRAIKEQLALEKEAHPKKKIGLVVFTSKVEIFGDCLTKDPIVIEDGNTLDNFDKLFEAGAKAFSKTMNAGVEKSHDPMAKLMNERDCDGCTALGPGVVVSLGLASKCKTGTTVVICTDGLANVGLGSIEYDKDSCPEFYPKAAEFAKKLGTTVNIITLKGGECRVEYLGKLCEKTNGQVLRMEASKLVGKFADMMSEEVIATNVEATVHLGKGLVFRNEDEGLLNSLKNTWKNNVGNVCVDTQMTYEFRVSQESAIQSSYLIQSQILFETIDEAVILRVNTIKMNSTSILEEVLQGANVRLLATRASQTVSKESTANNLKHARKLMEAWNQLITVNARSANAGDEVIQKEIRNIEERNRETSHALNRKIQRGNKRGSIVFSDVESQLSFEEDARELSRSGSSDSDIGGMYNLKRCNSMIYMNSLHGSDNDDKNGSGSEEAKISGGLRLNESGFSVYSNHSGYLKNPSFLEDEKLDEVLSNHSFPGKRKNSFRLISDDHEIMSGADNKRLVRISQLRILPKFLVEDDDYVYCSD